ncbi:MAG: glycosyltransferase family 1 protein [Eubacteriales bacterium]|nr:glycosyltransferase family 1 protein [Eubacteriales bacterium]
MVRILHSVSVMNRAGIETMLMNYYRHMDRTKVQFDFLTSRNEDGDYDEEIKELGGRIFRSPSLNPLFYPRYIAFMQRLFKDNPEIKILHAHNEGMALYSLNGAKKYGIKNRIAHAHNTKIVMDYKWALKVFCKQFLRFSANHLWGCGRDAGIYFFGRKAWNEKGMIMHNAIEPSKFKYNPEYRTKIREAYGIGDETLIGMVGRFNTQKNHVRMLDIFEAYLKLDNTAKLVFIGEGNLEDEIKEKAGEKGIDGNIIFAGLQSNVNEWYQAMDVFVMPSLFEGLPVVGIEAQAAGLPCVFSKSITDEIVLSSDSVRVELSETDDTWADVLFKAAHRENDRSNGVKIIADAGYDINIEAKKIEAIYLEMAGE